MSVLLENPGSARYYFRQKKLPICSRFRTKNYTYEFTFPSGIRNLVGCNSIRIFTEDKLDSIEEVGLDIDEYLRFIGDIWDIDYDNKEPGIKYNYLFDKSYQLMPFDSKIHCKKAGEVISNFLEDNYIINNAISTKTWYSDRFDPLMLDNLFSQVYDINFGIFVIATFRTKPVYCFIRGLM